MLALRKTGKLEEAKPIEKRMAELQHQSDRASEVGLAASGLNDEGIQLEKSGTSGELWPSIGLLWIWIPPPSASA
jgi:hypothetical protein